MTLREKNTSVSVTKRIDNNKKYGLKFKPCSTRLDYKRMIHNMNYALTVI